MVPVERGEVDPVDVRELMHALKDTPDGWKVSVVNGYVLVVSPDASDEEIVIGYL